MNVAAIPVELRQLPRWIVWRWGEVDPTTGKRKKPPYPATAPGGHRHASNKKPEDWSPFEQAVAVVEAGQADGIGFALEPPWVGVDLDEELPETDQAAVVLALDSYTERSQSGTGHHIVVNADLNGRGRHPEGIGVFTQDRFFYFTGDHVAGTPTTIEDRQAELETVLAQFLPANPVGEWSHPPTRPVDLDDRELLDRMFAASNGSEIRRLWNGDISQYGNDHSRADLALCSHLAFWTGNDPARIDRLFRSSGLYRDKWDRSDYRKLTIEAALVDDPYDPSDRSRGSDAPDSGRSEPDPQPEPDDRDHPGTVRADRVTMRSIDWLDKPFLQRSAFQLFAGPKGLGKGTKLAGIAASFTRGVYGDKTNVIYVSSEDSMEVDTVPRLHAARADLTKVTFVTRAIKLPADVGWIRDLATTIGDVGLIILDPIGNHVGGVDTDKEGLVRHAIGGLNDLANELHNTIVGVRHLTKNTAGGALASVLGSTAWRDIPRAVIGFARDDQDDDLIHWQVIAGNRSGRGSARQFRIELRDVGLKEPVTFADDDGPSAKDVDELLREPRGDGRPGSKSDEARELILDILDDEGVQESDALDARVASESGLAARTIRNLRTRLVTEGLVRAIPEKGEYGEVVLWKVSRTLAPRA